MHERIWSQKYFDKMTKLYEDEYKKLVNFVSIRFNWGYDFDRSDQIKKIPVFRVTRPYLNLMVKPRSFFMFSGKKYNVMHFERHFAFQNA